MMLQLDGLSDVQRAVPMSAAQFGNDFILTTLLQHTLYVHIQGLLEILLCLLELHLGLFQLLLLLVGWHVRPFGVRAFGCHVRPFGVRAFAAWGLYLDRFVRGLSPGIAVLGIAVLGIAVGWPVEHLAVKFALFLGYFRHVRGQVPGRSISASLWAARDLSPGMLLAVAGALVGGLKGLFVARAAPVVAASNSVALYGTLHIAYAQVSLRRMTTLPYLYRL